MTSPDRTSVRNRLLALMSADDFALLAPDLEHMSLPVRHVIAQPDELIEHVYFLESGIGSMVAVSPEGLQAEAGLFGRDGVTPAAPLLGADTSPHSIYMQVRGDGWRLGRERFEDLLNASRSLRKLLTLYAQTLVVQTTYTALSNAVHPIDERLARWILMCDDRTDGGGIALTHEFMSVMLAVRRPSVTTALHVLEGNGFIRSERGSVIVTNRSALEQFAGDAYGKPEATYRKLIGPLS